MLFCLCFSKEKRENKTNKEFPKINQKPSSIKWKKDLQKNETIPYNIFEVYLLSEKHIATQNNKKNIYLRIFNLKKVVLFAWEPGYRKEKITCRYKYQNHECYMIFEFFKCSITLRIFFPKRTEWKYFVTFINIGAHKMQKH